MNSDKHFPYFQVFVEFGQIADDFLYAHYVHVD